VAAIKAGASQAEMIAKSCQGKWPMPQSSLVDAVLDPGITRWAASM
jgi:hypothetical protein